MAKTLITTWTLQLTLAVPFAYCGDNLCRAGRENFAQNVLIEGERPDVAITRTLDGRHGRDEGH